jgi:CDP-diacylglycerol--glycerol-3-phosphate 3-phosphatidyltransferase
MAAFFAAIAGSFVVPYAKARAEANGAKCDVGLFPREIRVLAYAAGVILSWIVPLIWVLAIMTNVTAVQRIVYVARQLRD